MKIKGAHNLNFLTEASRGQTMQSNQHSDTLKTQPEKLFTQQMCWFNRHILHFYVQKEKENNDNLSHEKNILKKVFLHFICMIFSAKRMFTALSHLVNRR